MKNEFRALAFVCLACGLAGAQTLTDGLTNYRVNGQAVASQYGFWKLQSITGSGFTWPSSQAYATVGTGKNIFPFNTNATVKIVDAVAANTETVALNSYSYTTAGLTLNTAAANPHASFYVTSGTCGLKEAMNDLGSSGTILVTQDFYNLGCTASTITGISGGSSALSIRDISYGNDVTYTWNGAAYARGPSDGMIPFGPADVAGSASGNTTGTNGFTAIGTANVPVMQVSTSSTGTNTHTYVIDITKIASRSTAGKGAAITGLNFYYGAQGAAPASMSAPTCGTITMPAAGASETASTVTPVAAGGTITATPAVGSFNSATTTAGAFYNAALSFGTPIPVNTSGQAIECTFAFVGSATTAFTTNTIGGQLVYSYASQF